MLPARPSTVVSAAATPNTLSIIPEIPSLSRRCPSFPNRYAGTRCDSYAVRPSCSEAVLHAHPEHPRQTGGHNGSSGIVDRVARSSDEVGIGDQHLRTDVAQDVLRCTVVEGIVDIRRNAQVLHRFDADAEIDRGRRSGPVDVGWIAIARPFVIHIRITEQTPTIGEHALIGCPKR